MTQDPVHGNCVSKSTIATVLKEKEITDIGYTKFQSHRGYYERGYNQALEDIRKALIGNDK